MKNESANKTIFKRIFEQQETGIVLILFGLVTLFTILNPAFISQTNVYSLLNTVAFTGIVAVGVTIIIISGDIDISVGSTAGLGAITSTYIMMETNCFGMWGSGAEWFGVVLCMILGLLICAVVGFVNALLVVVVRMPAFIATIATLNSVRGIVNVITKGVPIYPLPETFMDGLGGWQLSLTEAGGLSIPFFLFILLLIIVQFVLRRTTFGRNIYATGSNRSVAKISGINTDRVRFQNFILTAMLAGFAGMLVAAVTSQGYPPIGTGWELQIIAGVVVGGASLKGGAGSMIGTLAGVLIISVLNVGLIMLGINTFIQTSIQGAMILLAVYIDILRKNTKIRA